jgi:predicted XRE-type DNA-binding protein
VEETTETVDVGTGDVFRDLGYADSAERKLRVQLAMRVNEIIKDKHMTQAVAAALFGIPQPHVSELKHCKLNRFASERLLHFMTQLDRDVEIVIRPRDATNPARSGSVFGTPNPVGAIAHRDHFVLRVKNGVHIRPAVDLVGGQRFGQRGLSHAAEIHHPAAVRRMRDPAVGEQRFQGLSGDAAALHAHSGVAADDSKFHVFLLA